MKNDELEKKFILYATLGDLKLKFPKVKSCLASDLKKVRTPNSNT
jgi:hypothetical protein